MNRAEPITIGKIWRNRYRTEFICVAIKQYEGAAYLDVRVWRQDVDGRSIPTDRGRHYRRPKDRGARRDDRQSVRDGEKARSYPRVRAMSEPAIEHTTAPAPAPLDVLELRAWARAYLWAIGELELHEAVDVLAEFAERAGVDPDLAQQILADAFAPFRKEEPPA
jgi:hypothetical protein